MKKEKAVKVRQCIVRLVEALINANEDSRYIIDVHIEEDELDKLLAEEEK